MVGAEELSQGSAGTVSGSRPAPHPVKRYNRSHWIPGNAGTAITNLSSSRESHQAGVLRGLDSWGCAKQRSSAQNLAGKHRTFPGNAQLRPALHRKVKVSGNTERERPWLWASGRCLTRRFCIDAVSKSKFGARIGSTQVISIKINIPDFTGTK